MTKTNRLNYTAMSLSEAISKIQILYQQEYSSAMDKEAVAKALGCSGVNASTAIISALTEYGLLENVGTHLKVTKDAIDIISHAPGHPTRVMALNNVAFTPYLFGKLHDAFGEDPPNDNILRSFLIKEGFSAKTIGNVIDDYRYTLMFLKEELVSSVKNPDRQRPLPSITTQRSDNAACKKLPLVTPGSFGQTLMYRIADNCSVRIQFDGPVVREGIEKLIALLELSADAFPQKRDARKRINNGSFLTLMTIDNEE
ncbi:MAG: hypothetical protein JOZ78_04300 [Chroococcidiopsidaceae cyanobacterium CP_BM_ER_R8_30]|nr:hypothetical protein [Chroococcidiopsidaceae cyanobacterium CP_BM_ER_R8_30]